MFDRFTDRARKVMGLSRQAAQDLGHDYIGTEHMLLGLIQERTGVASDVLRNLDADLKKIRTELLKLVSRGSTWVTMGQLPFTPRGRKVLELGYEEATALGHNYIGTEHLLLGLIREEGGVAAHVLRNTGVRLEDVREEVLELLGAPDSLGCVKLLGFDDEAMPSAHVATVLALLEERGIEAGSADDCGGVIAFEPWRDPLRMFEVGVARGLGLSVIVLHLPGETMDLPGIVSIELGENFEKALAAIFRPGS